MKKILSLLLVFTLLTGMIYVPSAAAYTGLDGESTRMFYGSQLNDIEGAIYDGIMENGEEFATTDKDYRLKIAIPDEYCHCVYIPKSEFKTVDMSNPDFNDKSFVSDFNKELQSMEVFTAENNDMNKMTDKAMNAFMLDSLNTSWLRSYNRGYSYSFSISGENVVFSFKTVYLFCTSLYYAGAIDDIDEVNAALVEMEQEIRDNYGITDKSSSYQKVKAVSDYVGNRVDYYTGDLSTNEQINANGHLFTIAGAALSKFDENGKCYVVCEGYCKTVRYLLDRFGVESIIVRGGSKRDDTGNVIVNHMWLYIKMDDGKWYGSDPTWDDQTDTNMASVLTDYLLMGKNTVPKHFDKPAFGEDHIPSEQILSSTYESAKYVRFSYPEISDDYYVRMWFTDSDGNETETLTAYPGEVFDLEELIQIESPYDKQTLTFTSSNTDAVSINGKYATMVDEGTSAVKATFNESYTATLVVNVLGNIKEIIPEKDTYVTNVSTSAQILFTTYPPDQATAADIDWKSSNKDIATVNEAGLVTPVSKGNVTITGTYKEDSDISFSVTVKVVQPISHIEITDNPAPSAENVDTLIKGETVKLVAVANPDDYTEEYIWESSNTAVATVKDGVVTAAGGGNAVITVRSESGDVSDSYFVYVRVPLEKVTLSYPDKMILVDQIMFPDMSFVPSDTNDSRNIRYETSDDSICSVDEYTGAIRGEAPGEATITLFTDYDEIFATYTVTVKQLVPGFAIYTEGSSEEIDFLRLNKNDTVKLSYEILEKDISYWGNVSWRSNRPSIVTVSEDGTVTAVSAGETQILVVSDLGVSSYIDVEVVVPMESFTATPTDAHIGVDEETKIKFTFDPVDTTDPDEYGIYADIQDPEIVDVSDDGLIGLKAGYTKVTLSIGDFKQEFYIHVYEVPEVEVKSKDGNGITLQWNKTDFTDGYVIQRSTDGESFVDLEKIDVDSFNGTYTDTTVLPNSVYYYRCAAVKDLDGESFTTPYSNTVSATISIDTPEISYVKALNSSEISIAWDKITGATGYTVYYSLDEKDYKELATVDADKLTYTHTGVDFAYLYYYKVTANIGEFKSGYSDAVQGRANIPTPKIKSVTSASYTSAKIQWTAIKGVTGYYLYRSTDNKKWTAIATVKGASTSSYTDKSLTCGKTYYYTLRAYVQVGTEAIRSGYNSGVGVKIIPATPQISSVKWKSCTSAQITWNKIAGADKYLLYRSDKSATGSWTKIATLTDTSYTDKALTCGAEYYYTVKAYNNASKTYSKYNNGTKITMVPSKPLISSAVCTSYKSIKLTWNRISEASGYYVYRTTNSDGTGYKKLERIAGSKNVTYTDNTAVCGVTYYYTVRAFKKYNGKDVLSSYNKLGTSCKAILATPKIQGAVSVNYNSIKLNWAKSDGAQGYIIYRSTSKNSGWQKIGTVNKGTTITYTDKTAVCGTQYYYTMRSYRTVDGKTVTSGYVKTGIAGKAIPNTPAISKAKIVNSKKIQLTWNKIDGANGYVIYRSTKKSGSWTSIATISSGNTVVYNDTGISNATNVTYYYTIRAYRTVSGKRVYSTYKTTGTASAK